MATAISTRRRLGVALLTVVVILSCITRCSASAMRGAAIDDSDDMVFDEDRDDQRFGVPTPPPEIVPNIHAAPAPFTLFQKERLCDHDFKGYNKALRLISVDPEPVGMTYRFPATPQTPAPLKSASNAKYPRIFCYVNTISPYHKSHAQLVAETWAQRCDKTVFFSNETTVLTVNEGKANKITFEVIKMNAPADYKHLWMKHKEVVKYIYDHYRHDYDWFYKADDDAYVVVDNLRAYLRRPEIMMNYKRQPMQLGKRYNLTSHRVDKFIKDKKMRREWWSKWDRWIYDTGGPGYAMNRLFVDKFVAAMGDKKCFSKWETSPEDTGTSFCMMWHGVVPWDTRDLHGRPRWHHFHPGDAYDWLPKRRRVANQGLGGHKLYDDCCAEDSVGFHYVKGPGMHHMERMLYFCRTGDDVPDVAAFNRKFGLAISDKILQPPL